MFVERKPARKKSLSSAFLCAITLVHFPAYSQPSSSDDLGAESDAQDTSPLNQEVIALEIGQQHVLPAVGVRSYSEGVRGVVDVRLTKSGDQFVLVGQAEGETSLLLIMLDGTQKNFRIRVGNPKKKSTASVSHDVKREDNIRLDFYFVQIDRSNHHQIGMGYPSSVAVNAAASFDFMSQRFDSATAVVENQALLRLDMAQSSGWAKLMRKAAVITENGKRAEFSGGGEVNLPVIGSLATGIHTIDFGSRIEVLPRYDSSTGRLQIEISADVSDLTDDRGTGAPGRITASISSIVNLELGQALVLAGLTSESKVKNRTGIPVLSQLPIIGYLFGSERLSRQAADNVIFIVPTVLDAATRDAREEIQSALRAYTSYKGGNAERQAIQRTWSNK